MNSYVACGSIHYNELGIFFLDTQTTPNASNMQKRIPNTSMMISIVDIPVVDEDVVDEDVVDEDVVDGHPSGQHPSSHPYRNPLLMNPHMGPLVLSPVVGVIPTVGKV